MIVFVIKTLVYFCFPLLMYWAAKKRINIRKYRLLSISNDYSGRGEAFKISHLNVMLLSCLAGIYSILCTAPAGNGLDRAGYQLRFSSDVYLDYFKENSIGLYWIVKLLHLFTYNQTIFVFTISFLSLALVLIAYNIFPNRNPKSLIYLGCSTYIMWSMALFKQSLAVGFIAISFSLLLRERRIASILFLAVAIAFHESAIVMAILWVCLIGSKNKIISYLEYTLLFVITFGYRWIVPVIASIFVLIVPSLGGQMGTYFDVLSSDHGLTILKGMPYYIIVMAAIFLGSNLKNKIGNYEKLLIMSIFCATTFVSSFFMYWMWRFGYYCFFPATCLAAELSKKVENYNSRLFLKTTIIGSMVLLTGRELLIHFINYGGF